MKHDKAFSAKPSERPLDRVLSSSVKGQRLKKISYREILGPQLVFINLTMNDKERNQRLLDRHEGDEQIVKLMEVDTSKRPDQTLNISLKEFGENMKKGGDESDLIQVQVTAKMSKDEVVENILKII